MAEVNVRVSDSGRLFPDAVVIKVDEQEIIAGQDGISPVVTVTEIGTAEAVSSHGYEVDVSDAAGVHTYSVYDGASAYAQAVAGGYSGTEEEFAADLIGFNTRAAEATAGATAAAAYADAASDSATAAATSESNAADSATAAASSASEAASSAQETSASATAASQAEGNAANSATAAAGSATAAAGSASTASTAATTAQGHATNAASSATAASGSATSAASSATAAGNAQTAAETAQAAAEDAQEAAEAVLASIPSDYTELSDDVDDLKSAISDISNISYTKYPGYISGSGPISQPSSNNEVYTSKISAIAGQSFAFSFRSSTTNLGNWCAYALYDENDNFISRTVFISNVLSNEVSQIVTIPQTLQNSTARYISFTWRNFNDGEETISVSNLNSVLSQVKSECIAPLILSPAKNYVDITITDTASSINFPADVLACTNAGYVQITTTETEIDISSSAIATTAIKVVYNLSTKQFGLCAYNIPLSPQQILIASIRRHVANPSIFIGCNYALNGKPFGIDFVNGHAHVLSINHRGYYTAPENTLPAYILSKQKGFDYVECDVAFTSDGVPVLLHDAAINRTARNADGSAISQEININDITYEQALQYDFGIYKSDSYAGTKIPTLAQFIGLCKNLGLYPYIELKDTATYSEAQISGLIDIVRSYGMLRDVTWISFNSTYLGYVKNADSEARLGLICGDITQTIIDGAVALKTSSNDVFIDAYYSDPEHQPGNIPRCISAGIPVEVWTVDTTTAITGMNPYITGVTSNRLIASSVLYESAIE